MKLKINEIYKSIQGESTFSGLPCTFIRLTFCNLRCSYCDTEYAFYEGSDMRISDIIKKVNQLNCNLVEVTGGEPLVQEACIDLLKSLVLNGNTSHADIDLSAFEKVFLLPYQPTSENLVTDFALKIKKRLPIFIEQDEMEELLNNIDFESGFIGERDKLIIELFYVTGIRLSELINIKITDRIFILFITR